MKSFKRYFLFISLVVVVVLVAGYFLCAIYLAQQATQDTKIKSDVIVVLGARSYIGGKYNPCLMARVDHAADLYKAKYAPKILMTGGNDKEDNVNEAETMRKIAVELRVPTKDVLLEKNATSTYENFTLSQTILQTNNLSTIIIVTEPFHIARASLVAKKLNYKYTLSPAVDSSCWQPNKYFTKYFLKEPFAITAYKVQGKL